MSRRWGEISTIGLTRSILSPSTNCTWFISGNSEDHVTLTFTYIDIYTYRPNTNSSTCDTTFVEVLDGEDEDAPSLGKFCAGTIPPALTSRGSSLVVKLFQRNGVGQGFRATYEISASACGGTLVALEGSFTSPNYPVGYPMNAECIWNVQSSPGNKVLISFRQMAIESSDYCNNDFVEIHEGSSSGTLLGHYCGDSVPGNATAAENIWVLFRSDGEGQAAGFWADYALQHGNELNGSDGEIASPLWPTSGFYSGDFYWRVTVGENMVIRVAFTEFSIGSAPTTQCYDSRISFKIHDGYDETAPTILNQCGQTVPEPVTSTGNVIYIAYKKPVLHGYGSFHLRWSEISPPELQILGSTNITGCGGNFTIGPNNKTTLLSPNYPSPYISNMRCEWYIFTDQLHRVKLKVEDFDVESSASCRYDKVEFYDTADSGDDYVLNSTQCQRTLSGTTLVSKGRSLKIVMVSDASLERPGFNFTISTECGGIIRSMNGEVGRITSPNYGHGNYDHSICFWVLIVRPGRTIKITFNDMNISAPPQGGCTTDYLVLRNGGHPDSPLLGTGRYCGNNKPPDMETSSNRLYVKFLTFSSGGRGFSLTYSEISQRCGGQIMLTEDVREFTFNSPNFNLPPPPYTECEWVISAPPHDAVQIDFLLTFDLTTTFG
ncbi:unnamed protein product [Allacma fusca]|uniref:CUB domain-containing protein n=1 Tax=Allacma fusca TaxID=39272 RepID=A0A8J2NUX6_9HEXA|nr:unnamed protein product [Allacma fusca]